MRISDWSSDVCSSDLEQLARSRLAQAPCRIHSNTQRLPTFLLFHVLPLHLLTSRRSTATKICRASTSPTSKLRRPPRQSPLHLSQKIFTLTPQVTERSLKRFTTGIWL